MIAGQPQAQAQTTGGWPRGEGSWDPLPVGPVAETFWGGSLHYRTGVTIVKRADGAMVIQGGVFDGRVIDSAAAFAILMSFIFEPHLEDVPVIGGVVSWTQGLAKLISRLLRPGFWWAVLLFSAALAAIVAGVLIYFRTPQQFMNAAAAKAAVA